MTDPRYSKLAKLLVNYSTALKKGERILLDMIDVPDEFTVEMIRAVRAAGATPFVETRHTRVGREQLLGITEAQAADIRDLEMFRMKKMQAYVAVRGSGNASENADVPSNLMQMYSKVIRPVLDYRVNKTRWVVLRWPTPSMAQAAGMSTEAFENLYFDVCTMDYAKMAKAMTPLEKLMKKTDEVHIEGPGTDLTFSIKGIGAKKCEGTRNIPDGEVFFLPDENVGERRHPVQHADAVCGHEVRERETGIEERQGGQCHGEQRETVERNFGYGRRRAFHRRVRHRFQSAHLESDVRYLVR